MDRERQKILSMLEDGRITTDQAVKLLNAVDPPDIPGCGTGTRPSDDILFESMNNMIDDFNRKAADIYHNLPDNLSSIGEKLNDMLSDSLKHLGSNLKSIQQSLESIIPGIGCDLGSSIDMVSSKLKEETSDFSSLIDEKCNIKTGSLGRSINEMGKSLNGINIDPSSLSQSLSNALSGLASQNNAGHVLSESYRKTVSSPSTLCVEFTGINGHVSLEGYDGSEIEADVYLSPGDRTIEQAVSITDQENLYIIGADGPDDMWMSLDVRIPKKAFKSINIKTSNGKINASDIACGKLLCTGTNSRISLADTACDVIEANTSYGKIQLFRIKTGKLYASTNDSPVIIDNTSCSTSDIITMNGSIFLEMSDAVYGNNEYRLNTENGQIEIELAVPSDTGIYIDALCQNGDIGISNIPGFSCDTDDDKKKKMTHSIGQTQNYDGNKNSIKILARTSNSSIIVK